MVSFFLSSKDNIVRSILSFKECHDLLHQSVRFRLKASPLYTHLERWLLGVGRSQQSPPTLYTCGPASLFSFIALLSPQPDWFSCLQPDLQFLILQVLWISWTIFLFVLLVFWKKKCLPFLEGFVFCYESCFLLFLIRKSLWVKNLSLPTPVLPKNKSFFLK